MEARKQRYHLQSMHMKTKNVPVNSALLVFTSTDIGSLLFGLLSKNTRAKGLTNCFNQASCIHVDVIEDILH